MSGKQETSITSEFYRLVLSGGISSWDYDRVREQDRVLGESLQRLKPALDAAFERERGRAGLQVLPWTQASDRITWVEQAVSGTSFVVYIGLRPPGQAADAGALAQAMAEVVGEAEGMRGLLY